MGDQSIVPVVNGPYSGCPWFGSQPGDRISWFKFSSVPV